MDAVLIANLLGMTAPWFVLINSLTEAEHSIFSQVWGQCSHCFHIHCIMKWLGTQQTQHQCPMCRQEWKFKE